MGTPSEAASDQTISDRMAGKASPAPEMDPKAKESFESVQKKLPGLVAERARSRMVTGDNQPDPGQPPVG
jgi:hypothetical protein